MDTDELLEFRRMTGKDFKISANEADILFNINDVVETPDGWPEYFINAISDYLLYQNPPQGYITTAKAAWLRARIDHDGVVESETELALLLSLLKQANNVTDDISEGDEMFNQPDMAQAEKITSLEASWLIERLNRDGQLDKNEKALLAYLKQECPNIHANLTPLLNAA